MKRTNWLDRKFPPVEDNGLLPMIIERLEGTAARISDKARKYPGEMNSPAPQGQWSVKKEIGHLLDLEPLWLERMHQILSGQAEMSAADMSNARTNETDHDLDALDSLIDRLRQEREKLVNGLRNASEQDLNKISLHPRLKSPMKLVDLAMFVAEHDDHHLSKISQMLLE